MGGKLPQALGISSWKRRFPAYFVVEARVNVDEPVGAGDRFSAQQVRCTEGEKYCKFLHVSINIVPVVEDQSNSRETQLIWSSSVESGTPHLLIPGMEGGLAHRHEGQPHIL